MPTHSSPSSTKDTTAPRPPGKKATPGGQKVMLRIHGKALAAEGSKLYLEGCNSPHSVWTITHLHDDVVDIKVHNGHFLAANREGRAYLISHEGEGGDTDFHLEHRGPGRVAFRSKYGHYLRVHENGGWFFHSLHGSNSTFEEVVLEQ